MMPRRVTEVMPRPGERSLLAWLIVISGRREGDEYRLREDTVLGAGTSCDVIIDDESASDQHARIRRIDGQFVLQDMASRNGTLLNETECLKGVLHHGDQVTVGRTKLAFIAVDDGHGSNNDASEAHTE